MKQNYLDGDIHVRLVQYMGSDEMIADAARVSTDRDGEKRPYEGLIRYLAKEKHMSPFEHTSATFLIVAPLFVRDQWVRHRTQSYNVRSFRYSKIEPSMNDEIFYIPPEHRPLVNSGSGARPLFDTPPTPEERAWFLDLYSKSVYESWDTYQKMLNRGIAEEVARMVLPASTMTKFYATANLRNWNAFVKERTTGDNPQYEIKHAAWIVSHLLSEKFPVAWSELSKN